ALLAAKLIPESVAGDASQQYNPPGNIKAQAAGGCQCASSHQYRREQQREGHTLQQPGQHQHCVKMACHTVEQRFHGLSSWLLALGLCVLIPSFSGLSVVLPVASRRNIRVYIEVVGLFFSGGSWFFFSLRII